MKRLSSHLIFILVFLLVLPVIGSTQSNVTHAKGYMVDIITAPLSISRRQLDNAKTLIDLNKNYKPEWVKSYHSVTIVTISNGAVSEVVNNNDILNQSQMDHLSKADEGSDITIAVSYTPENNLANNDVKEMEFTFQVNPEHHAVFADGQQNLSDYLEQNKIQDIVTSTLDEDVLVAVRFTISADGEIENVNLFESSRDEETDDLLLKIVRNMPSWKPAEYASGMKVKQEMVLTAGNLESCVMNLLNIEKE